MQVGAGPPFQNPPQFGTFGAPLAHPFGSGCDFRRVGKIDSHARAKLLLAAALRNMPQCLTLYEKLAA